jgi:hypothetical protein
LRPLRKLGTVGCSPHFFNHVILSEVNGLARESIHGVERPAVCLRNRLAIGWCLVSTGEKQIPRVRMTVLRTITLRSGCQCIGGTSGRNERNARSLVPRVGDVALAVLRGGAGRRPHLRDQSNRGRADPPSNDGFILKILCWPSGPPQANIIETMGKPPARSVSPAPKLCFRWLNPRSPRVSATLP